MNFDVHVWYAQRLHNLENRRVRGTAPIELGNPTPGHSITAFDCQISLDYAIYLRTQTWRLLIVNFEIIGTL